MRVFLHLSLAVLSVGVMASCGGSGGGGAGATIEADLVGKLQKGPYIIGSQITINELNDDLNQTGVIFNTLTTNDLGEFELPATVESPWIELFANGFYFDEIAGATSDAQLSLQGIADLSVDSIVNLNLLTKLTYNRVKLLVSSGIGIEQATEQAKSELLSVFNIDPLDVGDVDNMDISIANKDGAILLAISAIIQQMAHEASNGQNTTGELSFILSSIDSDLASDGVIDNQGMISDITNASIMVDLELVRENLSSRYESLGSPIDVPEFEDFVDSDGSGSLNGDKFGYWLKPKLLEFDDSRPENGGAGSQGAAFVDNGVGLAYWHHFNSNGHSIFSRLVDSSGIWGAVSYISSGGHGHFPHGAVNKNNQAFVIFQSTLGPLQTPSTFVARFTPELGWLARVQLDAVNINISAGSQGAVVAIDGLGNSMAAWHQFGGAGRNDIWHNRYVVGSGWTGPDLVEFDDTGSAQTPEIAMADDGKVVLVWVQDFGGPGRLLANRYVPGTGWETEVIIDNSGIGPAANPSVVIAVNGDSFVIWEQNGEIYASAAEWGGVWSAPILVGSSGNQPNLSVLGAGEAMASWLDGVIKSRVFDIAGNMGPVEDVPDSAGTTSYSIAYNRNAVGLAVWGTTDIIGSLKLPGEGWRSGVLLEYGAGSASDSRTGISTTGSGTAIWRQMNIDGEFSFGDIWGARFRSN